jgi:glycyl-tRNA synthetase beta chain
MTDFLLELGTEEIPAGYIGPALVHMKEFAGRTLSEEAVSYGEIRTTATPRRLVLHVEGLPDRAPDREETFRGPSFEKAFDASGKPGKAAQAFARAKGVSPQALEVKETKKGRYVYALVKTPGRALPGILGSLVAGLVPSIPWPKSMRWNEEAPPFARPLRYVLAFFGKESVDLRIPGVPVRTEANAHPFIGPDRTVRISGADLRAYVEALREHFVFVDLEERREVLRGKIEAAMQAEGGAFTDEALLDEVTNLLEFPEIGVGAFAEEFLSLPGVLLEAAMMEHQRYFPVRLADGSLRPRFVTAVNRRDHLDTIVRGNERVLLARLWDARFFFKEDRKKRLEERVEGLSDVLYLKEAGSLAEKVNRLGRCAGFVAEKLGYGTNVREKAVRAARLCKADLLTEVVGEFPSLQGSVGTLYARLDGEDDEVAQAIDEHYMPRGLDAALPETDTGRALSLADKFQTLADCFALGLRPSGSKDPYALRRNALGILRILASAGKNVDLNEFIADAVSHAPRGKDFDAVNVRNEIYKFVQERMNQQLLDEGFPHDLVRAVLLVKPYDYVDARQRVRALMSVKDMDFWPDLVAVAERTRNITRDFSPQAMPEESLLAEEAEKALFRVLSDAQEGIRTLVNEKKYVEAARSFYESFSAPVHRFFDEVFVNVDDASLKDNRLRLVRYVSDLFHKGVADLSEIVTGR